MTLATDNQQCSEATARALTDRLRAACAETNELLAKLPRKSRNSPAANVYFIQAGDDGPIKIGSATDVAARMRLLQTGCPQELRLLASIVGSAAMERRFHAHFAHVHVRGEWFEPSDDLLTFISVLPR